MPGHQRLREIRCHRDWLRRGVRWAHALRLLGAVTLLLGVVGVVTVGTAQASQPAKAATNAWKVEPTPNQAGAEINGLSAVSCTSGRACTAVGTYADSLSSPIHAVVERWNGKHWSMQAPAKPKGATATEFFGVSCASVKDCVAVGVVAYKSSSGTLAEAWNGKNWRVQATPRIKGVPAGALYSVSCTSASACTAVGQYPTANAVAERWNGKTWRFQAVARPAKSTWFFGVSCSTARACTAVGYQHDSKPDAQPFAEAWNGRKWHAQPVPLPKGAPGGAFSAVSCTSPTACTATGTYFGPGLTLGERWNGKSWRIQSTPNPPNYSVSSTNVTLDGVSCTSAKACTAIGDYAPAGKAAYFIETWNGSKWRMVTAPVPVDFVQGALGGITCTLARCTAVGSWSGGPVSAATLAMAN
jgi:hypothetical protein